MPYLTYSMLLYLPLHYNEINLVDCMRLEPMSDQECDGAHSIMLLRLLTVHVTFLDNPYSWWTIVESNHYHGRVTAACYPLQQSSPI